MSWLPFAIAAPLLYGITNFFDKYLIEKRVRDPMLLTIFGGFVALLFGIIFWVSQLFPGVPLSAGLILVTSGCVFQWALIPYYKALQHDDTSRITPLFQVIPVLALVLAVIFLHERLHGTQVLGFAIVLIGGIALSLERLDRGVLRLRKSFWLMMLSSLMYTVPFVFFKSVDQPFWIALAYEFFGLGLGSAILMLLPNTRKRALATLPEIPGQTWWPIVANEVIYISGKMCTFYATTLVAVSLVTVMGAFQPLFVLLIGLGLTQFFPHIIKEDVRKNTLVLKGIATLAVVLGVIIIQSTR